MSDYDLIMKYLSQYYFKKNRKQLTNRQQHFLSKNWALTALGYTFNRPENKNIKSFMKYHRLRLKLIQP